MNPLDARGFYEIEAIKNNWSARELERQINSLLFARLAKSKDKAGLLCECLAGSPMCIGVRLPPLVTYSPARGAAIPFNCPRSSLTDGEMLAATAIGKAACRVQSESREPVEIVIAQSLNQVG